MVHALEQIHRLLKPTGVLIDIHPVAEASFVEIHQSGRIDLIDHWSVRQWCTDYQQADKALVKIVQLGLFTIEHETVFDSLTYYPSVAEMCADLKKTIAKFARDAQSADEAITQTEVLSARAEAFMLADVSGAELVIRERAHISCLRPT